MKLQLVSFMLVIGIKLTSPVALNFLDVLKGNTGPTRRLIIHRIGQCIGQKNLSIFFTDFTVSKYNRTKYVLNGESYIHETFPKGWENLMAVKKCEDFSSTGSCRPYFNGMLPGDMCSLLAAGNTLYTRYLEKVSPKPQCPFKKGTYVLKDQLIEDEFTRFYPGAGNDHWETKFSGKVGDRIVMCFVVQMSMRPIKGRDRT